MSGRARHDNSGVRGSTDGHAARDAGHGDEGRYYDPQSFHDVDADGYDVDEYVDDADDSGSARGAHDSRTRGGDYHRGSSGEGGATHEAPAAQGGRARMGVYAQAVTAANRMAAGVVVHDLDRTSDAQGFRNSTPRRFGSRGPAYEATLPPGTTLPDVLQKSSRESEGSRGRVARDRGDASGGSNGSAAGEDARHSGSGGRGGGRDASGDDYGGDEDGGDSWYSGEGNGGGYDDGDDRSGYDDDGAAADGGYGGANSRRGFKAPTPQRRAAAPAPARGRVASGAGGRVVATECTRQQGRSCRRRVRFLCWRGDVLPTAALRAWC